MLIHFIHAHEEPALNSFPVVVPHPTASGGFYGIDTKIGYAVYLGACGMTKGDWVVAKNACFPFEDKDFYRIEDIQEMYYMAKWGKERDFPFCLHMRSDSGMTFWGCPEYYTVVHSARPTSKWGTAKSLVA